MKIWSNIIVRWAPHALVHVTCEREYFNKFYINIIISQNLKDLFYKSKQKLIKSPTTVNEKRYKHFDILDAQERALRICNVHTYGRTVSNAMKFFFSLTKRSTNDDILTPTLRNHGWISLISQITVNDTVTPWSPSVNMSRLVSSTTELRAKNRNIIFTFISKVIDSEWQRRSLANK